MATLAELLTKAAKDKAEQLKKALLDERKRQLSGKATSGARKKETPKPTPASFPTPKPVYIPLSKPGIAPSFLKVPVAEAATAKQAFSSPVAGARSKLSPEQEKAKAEYEEFLARGVPSLSTLPKRLMAPEAKTDLKDAAEVSARRMDNFFRGLADTAKYINDIPGEFLQRQIDIAKIRPKSSKFKDVLESTLNFGSKFGEQGYKAAEWVIPPLRTATTVPKLIGVASQNILPEEISPYAGRLLQAIYVLRSPHALAALGNIGTDEAVDLISRATTGKNFYQAVDESNLPDWAKGTLKLVENVGSAWVGGYAQGVGNRAAPSLKAGYNVLKKTGKLGEAFDAATDVRRSLLEMDKRAELGIKNAVEEGDTEVKGWFSKKIKPQSEIELKAKGAKFNPLEEVYVKKQVKDLESYGFLKKVPRNKPIATLERTLELSPEEQAQMSGRLDALGLKTRSVKTFADIQRAGAELAAEPVHLLASNTTRLTAPELSGLKQLLRSNIDFIANNQKKLASLTSPIEQEVLQAKLNHADTQIDFALQKILPANTEAGRMIVANKIIGNKVLDPEFWILRAKKIIGTKVDVSPRIKQQIIELTKAKDVAGVASFVSSLRDASATEKFITLWKAGLLTSPTTHLANIFGNITLSALEDISRTVAAPIDEVASWFTGKRTTTNSFGQEGAKIKTFFGEALEDAKKYAKTGIYSSDIMDKYDLPRQVKFKHALPDTYTKLIFRSLGAEDIFFRKPAEMQSLVRQAEVQALNEKLSGQDYKLRVKELLLDPTRDMQLRAQADGAFATFNNPNALANHLSKWKVDLARKNTPIANMELVALEAISPFVRTPSNVALRAFDYSPLGGVAAVVRQFFPASQSQEAFSMGLGRSLTGSLLMFLGYKLAEDGKAIGNMPTSSTKRDMAEEEGKQSQSVLIDGNWVQLNRISPIGNLIGLGADIYRLEKEEGKEGLELFAASVGSGIKSLTNMTFLTGLSGGLKAVTEPERYAGSFIDNSVSSLVPTILTKLGNIKDPYMHTQDPGVLDALTKKLPLAKEGLPVRQSLFGRDVEVGGGPLSFLDPFNTRKSTPHPVINEARNLGISFGTAGEEQARTNLSAEEYAIYQKALGRKLETGLMELIQSMAYKKAGEPEKVKLFNKRLNKIRDEVYEETLPNLLMRHYRIYDEDKKKVLDAVLKASRNISWGSFNDEERARAVASELTGGKVTL